MSKKSAVSMTAVVACIGILFVIPVSAESPMGMGQPNMMSEHHQKQADMMKDMTQAMGSMTDEMSHGDLTPEQSKQMAQRMERMSAMMHRMAGLGSRPAMKDPEFQKQMDLMHKQMGEMKGDMPMGTKAK